MIGSPLLERRPYFLPDSLEELHGPREGMVTLPVTLCWQPKKIFDVADRPDRVRMYSEVVANGQPEDFRALLDREYLIEMWPVLRVAWPVKKRWQDRFAELDPYRDDESGRNGSCWQAEIGLRLISVLEDQGRPLEWLADQVGYSVRILQDAIGGDRWSATLAFLCADALGVDRLWLATGHATAESLAWYEYGPLEEER